MNRRLRRGIELTLPLVGAVIIFAVVLLAETLTIEMQLLLVLIGILILEAGVWGVSDRILPNERRHFGLRKEGDQFVSLIRQLSRSAALIEDDNFDSFQDTLAKMHASVDLMGELARKQLK